MKTAKMNNVVVNRVVGGVFVVVVDNEPCSCL